MTLRHFVATTSGRVRASVIDAFGHNDRAAPVEDGCFDRSQAGHAIDLRDMHAQYADVVDGGEALSFMNALPDGLFDLPPGTESDSVAAVS